MSFRNMSAWAIRNPVSPLVLFVALLLAGMVSFGRMDINQQPDITFPIAQVLVLQPGAAPPELETQVTQRVEAAVRGISGVDEITSTVSEGKSCALAPRPPSPMASTAPPASRPRARPRRRRLR